MDPMQAQQMNASRQAAMLAHDRSQSGGESSGGGSGDGVFSQTISGLNSIIPIKLEGIFEILAGDLGKWDKLMPKNTYFQYNGMAGASLARQPKPGGYWGIK